MQLRPSLGLLFELLADGDGLPASAQQLLLLRKGCRCRSQQRIRGAALGQMRASQRGKELGVHLVCRTVRGYRA